MSLAVQGLDGDLLALTVLRCALSVARMLHAGWLIKASGPWRRDLGAVPARALRYFQRGNRSERLSCALVLVAAVAVYFPSLVYWAHANQGQDQLAAALTGIGPQNGINCYLKLFVFEVLILAAAPKLAMRTVVAGLFLVQWPLMFGMYYDAPIPLVHGGVEAYEIALVVVAYKVWRRRAAGAVAVQPATG